MENQHQNGSMPGETWKELNIEFETTNQNLLEISNYGRIRSTNRLHKGKILNCCNSNGYRTLKIKFYRHRSPQMQQQLDYLKGQISQLEKDVRKLRNAAKSAQGEKLSDKQARELAENEELLAVMRKNYKEKYHKDELSRVINYSLLIHRAVAEHFCTRPSEAHDKVIHLDFNKSNNRYTNLKWANKEEILEHQKNSPYTHAALKERAAKGRIENAKNYKLNESSVMLIKKKMGKGVPLKTIAKQFKVTVTQLKRIERGENWGDVPAAL